MKRRTLVLSAVFALGFGLPLAATLLATDPVNLAKDPVGRRELAAFTGHMTFPQIVIGDEPLGGFQELVEADETGRLERLAA